MQERTYSSDNRLGNKGTHGVGPEPLELGIQLGRKTRHIGLVRLLLDDRAAAFAAPFPAVGKARRYPRHIRGHHGLKHLPAHLVAADGERAQRDAVVRLAACNEPGPARLGLVLFQKVLPCQLHGGLDGFRPRADNVGARHVAVGGVDEVAAQLLADVAGVENGGTVGRGAHLGHGGIGDAAVAVSDAGDGGTARGIEDPTAVAEHEVAALAVVDRGEIAAQLAVQHCRR